MIKEETMTLPENLVWIFDQISEVGDLEAKKMFSSYGLYCDDVFFAIYNNGVLYMKTNAWTAEKYRKAGMKPFAPSYKQILRNYYQVPDDILESPDEFTDWVYEALEA